MLRSGIEDRTLAELKAFSSKGKYRVGYEEDKIPYFIEGNYIPDFTLEFKDGRPPIYIETKGQLDAEAKRKMEAVKRQHPDKDIRIIFERDQPIRKRAKMRYSDWAKKYGFPFSIKIIPTDWLT